MFTKVENGWLHSGFGHRREKETGLYPVYPLPRWSTFCNYNRHAFGSFDDILHYMSFCQEDYRTSQLEITGDEIANTLCGLYTSDAANELKKFNAEYNYDFDSWTAVYDRLTKVKREEMIVALSR